ncbi:D-aminoacyl-tRNA deacylase [Sharpea azabuensis]|uniref:D-aminoacyl-tRNA deacylase n=1 Tax=Sharpea azabuensis TaxID=322505 RepID=UPI00156813F4|nr:D-aminoacyl-tRNA deacylase [Sharpea azabuensis]
MRIVLQRVSHASVTIEGQVHGQINQGYMILVGFKGEDDEAIIDRMVDKVIHLRVFEDDQGKMNLSLLDVKGAILSISQFTLYANSRKGRRPSFVEAAKPGISSPLYDLFNSRLEEAGIHVEKGIFGADMKCELLNDGPVTILLDSDELFH